jgi:aminoglycoside phosphotransferase (APT) family kinase protein
VMDRVDGRVPTDNPPYTAAGWVAEATPAQRRRLWESAVAVLARLHGVDPGRAPFLRSGEASSGLEEWLRYWVDYCTVASGGSLHPTLAAGLDWLHARRPDPPVTELAWGDARIGNMVFRGFRVAAVLDWDLVSLGGSVSDLAWWVLREHPAADMLPGIGTARETVSLWQQLTGRRAENLDYHLVFAALRLGAIRLRLARQHAGEALGPGLTTSDNGGLQQLSVLLGLRRASQAGVTLPDLG